MSETFIQLPTDGTGKKHRSWENTVGADDVHATAGVITAPDGTVLSNEEGVAVADGPPLVVTDTIGALNETVEISLDGRDIVGIQITGTWDATLRVDVSYAETPGADDWFNVTAASYDGVVQYEFTGNTFANLASLGYRWLRLIASAYTSGSADVLLAARRGNVPGVIGCAGERLDVFIGPPPTNISSFQGSYIRSAAMLYAYDAQTSDFRTLQVTYPSVDAAAATGAGTQGLQTNARLYAYNGATFDRLRGTTANGLDVDVTRLPALAAGTNNIGDVDVASLPGTVAADITAIKTATELIDNAIAGSEMQVDVVAALPAGTNNIGDIDVLSLPAAATATLSNVATSNASAQLLASNAARKGAIIYNDSLVVMYVKFGTTASATSFTYYLVAGATLELPSSPVYTGRIDAILASSTGTARVTELT